MKKNKDKSFRQDIESLIEQVNRLLDKINIDEYRHDQVLELYGLLHNLDELAGAFGINSILKLSSKLENLIGDIRSGTRTLTTSIITLVYSGSEVIKKLLDDPTLKDSPNKVSYENLLREIDKESKKGGRESGAKEDSKLYNNKFEEVFVEEAIDLINQLEEKMLQLEGDPDDKQLVNDIFRIMHTIKGNSNMFGYQNLGDITHYLENVYDEIRSNKIKNDRNILEITLQCIDHFRALLEDPELQVAENRELQQAILKELKQVTDMKEEIAGEETVTKDTGSGKTYYIYFKPNHDVFDDGTNPLYFVYDLNELGDCLIIANDEQLPANNLYDPHRCYVLWHILIYTTESFENIRDQFIFLKEESQPVIRILSGDNLIKNKKFKAWFEEQSEQTNPLPENINLDEYISVSQKTKKLSLDETKSKQETAISSIRVSSAKIDKMMNLISELVTKQAELSILATDSHNSQFQEVAESIESISRDLRDNAFSISLIPIEKSVLRFQRLVRDVSAKFDKQVDFKVEGKETELDKTIIEKIVDPIMHILRNSIDHGIEKPDIRKKLGKPERGKITLKAYPSGAHVIIEISDDGGGINLDKVHQTAVKKGFVGQNEELTTDDMLKLIISPGFSTAENISEVSGRGVGMDVVSQKIKEIRGELDIKTEKNVGTTISIKLPLTISIIDSLLVNIGKTYYMIPLAVVERCSEVKLEQIKKVENNYLNLHGEFVPFIDLHEEFHIHDDRSDIQRLIIVSYRDFKVALVVDNIIGNHQAVLKSLGEAYKQQEVISGASILGNGEVALVLDTNKVIAAYMDADKLERMRGQAKLEASE